jgi:hypothetical protein
MEREQGEKYVDFSLFSAKAFSVSCCYNNDGNNNIVEEYFEPFLQFCVSISTHTISSSLYL